VFSVFVAVLLVGGLAGCADEPADTSEPAGTDESATAEDPSAESTEDGNRQRSTVELPEIDGAQLLEDYRNDPNHAAYAELPLSMVLVIDHERQEVSIELLVRTASVETGCAVGEDMALCLSEHATVTAVDGTVISDYDTPYGALYTAWSLSIRVTGEGGAESLVLDGWLPAGAGTMTWQ
jgi:hypothetical protein